MFGRKMDVRDFFSAKESYSQTRDRVIKETIRPDFRDRPSIEIRDKVTSGSSRHEPHITREKYEPHPVKESTQSTAISDVGKACLFGAASGAGVQAIKYGISPATVPAMISGAIGGCAGSSVYKMLGEGPVNAGTSGAVGGGVGVSLNGKSSVRDLIKGGIAGGGIKIAVETLKQELMREPTEAEIEKFMGDLMTKDWRE